ncbi:hypothetical protein DLM86_12395 [Paenibacillus flagellatus]|uniref:Uncharacterized protein n=1 Tax=Paenibacillus flagellatus TaxID=2211139 RepID=A0A2V5K8X3_9BACL|nr:hypothetical protein DLM86_12395 [Paenibacillus flagellatus]
MEAAAASFAAVAGVQLFLTARGFYVTDTYVPDIVKAYDNVDYLSDSVSIGRTRPIGWLEHSIVFLILCALYYSIRYLLWRAGRKR